MEEIKVLESTLKSNLEILSIVKNSDEQDKAKIYLSIFKELNKLCETIIPMFESRLKDTLKD
jgi:hypothetical protein|tara:strand:- start:259 stop:444 length:186 start_codon:yes stop_codon:yes gene_type:complete